MLTGPIWLVFGTADSSTGSSARDYGQGMELLWLWSKPPRYRAAPALAQCGAVREPASPVEGPTVNQFHVTTSFPGQN